MHPARAAFFLALAIFGTVPGAFAHVGPLVPIPQLSDDDLGRIDLFDVSVGDWVDVVGNPVLTAREFAGTYDPASLDFRIWLAWHDGTNRLYCAVERADDAYYNNFGDVIIGTANLGFAGHDSCVYFCIDGDHSGGKYLDVVGYLEPEDSNVQAQMYTTLAQTYGHGLLIKMIANTFRFRDLWFLQPPFADAGGGSFGERPVISVNEFYVTPFDRFDRNNPDASIASDLTAGAVVGFWMRVDDRDQPEWVWRDETLMFPAWSDNNEWPWTSDLFADGLLLPLLDAVEPHASASATSWARIKASLDLPANRAAR